jgi:hypothetical protein
MIVIIETSNNCIFGFYSNIGFDPSLSSKKYLLDSEAFLFTLTINGKLQPIKLPIKPSEAESAIFTDINLFFALGEGYDLYIPDHCDKVPSTAKFPCSYHLPMEIGYNPKNIFVNGADSFTVNEIEAYEVHTHYS